MNLEDSDFVQMGVAEPGCEILVGDCLDRLGDLPDATVQCCVTSPPYFGLRRYLFDKAVVLRNDLAEQELRHVTQELERRGIRPRC